MSVDRAFVVQISSEYRGGADLTGRVEHVHSGKAIHFESLAALSEFFQRSILLPAERNGEEPDLSEEAVG